MNHDAFELGLHDINNAGVYAIGNGDLGPLSAAMRDAGLRVVQIDLDGCQDKRTLLMRLAARLDFPTGFGGNWDAPTSTRCWRCSTKPAASGAKATYRSGPSWHCRMQMWNWTRTPRRRNPHRDRATPCVAAAVTPSGSATPCVAVTRRHAGPGGSHPWGRLYPPMRRGLIACRCRPAALS